MLEALRTYISKLSEVSGSEKECESNTLGVETIFHPGDREIDWLYKTEALTRLAKETDAKNTNRGIYIFILILILRLLNYLHLKFIIYI